MAWSTTSSGGTATAPRCKPRSITGHAAFEDTPLAVHDRLAGAHADGGGLLGQYFSPLTGKAAKAHGHTITLGALWSCVGILGMLCSCSVTLDALRSSSALGLLRLPGGSLHCLPAV